MLGEQRQIVQREIAEIDGVEDGKPILVLAVEGEDAAAGEVAALGRRDLVGGEAAILPALDDGAERARRPALLVDALGGEELLQEADLVVGVEDGEVRLEPDPPGMAGPGARGGPEGRSPEQAP